jgi:hypothetical protein
VIRSPAAIARLLFAGAAVLRWNLRMNWGWGDGGQLSLLVSRWRTARDFCTRFLPVDRDLANDQKPPTNDFS